MELIVGMGEYVVTDREDDTIRTFSLATCVGITVYCPQKKVAGMLHVVLPVPFTIKDKQERPSYFAETGIPLLIHEICRKFGCRKEELLIQMYGGAEPRLEQDIYSIGEKNIDAAKDALLRMGLTISKADLRGRDSRTISMEVKTGLVEVNRQPIIR